MFRFLIVEDNATHRNILLKLLSKHQELKGSTFLQADSLSTALEIIKDENFSDFGGLDAIILDPHLPDSTSPKHTYDEVVKATKNFMDVQSIYILSNFDAQSFARSIGKIRNKITFFDKNNVFQSQSDIISLVRELTQAGYRKSSRSSGNSSKIAEKVAALEVYLENAKESIKLLQTNVSGINLVLDGDRSTKGVNDELRSLWEKDAEFRREIDRIETKLSKVEDALAEIKEASLLQQRIYNVIKSITLHNKYVGMFFAAVFGTAWLVPFVELLVEFINK